MLTGAHATPAPPDRATLDQLERRAHAQHCGMANVRTVERLVLPAYQNPPEPTCEELEDGFTYGGP